MPKYKVKFTFEVEVEAPNKNIAQINAEYRLEPDTEYWLWDYLTKSEAVELEIPKELRNDFEKDDPKCTCTNCSIKDVCMYAWDNYNKDDNCLLSDK